jgi:CDP-diacylglycerol pyrophosphatase
MRLIPKRLKLGAAAALAAMLLSPATFSANRDALRQIVQGQCLVHWTERHDPSPCLRIELGDPPREETGYALLADQKGGAHFLLIPTRTITGIESADLLQRDAPNYLATAWQARERLEAAVGHALPRDTVGLAVNPLQARSQNQLHIHIECLRADVRKTLAGRAGYLTGGWRTVRVGAYKFEGREILGETLDGENPFKILDERIREEHGVIGNYTLVIAGVQSPTGPGFIMLTARSRAGELLLDPTCAVAGAS